MTKKLEDLFDLPSSTADTADAVPDIATTQYAITEINNAIDKIDAALPSVRDLEASDLYNYGVSSYAFRCSGYGVWCECDSHVVSRYSMVCVHLYIHKHTYIYTGVCTHVYVYHVT